MVDQSQVYITISWQERDSKIDLSRGGPETQRYVCSPTSFPQILPCKNPHCNGGGFEIGERVFTLLRSGADSEQNSMVCRNSINPERARRCFHTIIYSIACVRPFANV